MTHNMFNHTGKFFMKIYIRKSAYLAFLRTFKIWNAPFELELFKCIIFGIKVIAKHFEL